MSSGYSSQDDQRVSGSHCIFSRSLSALCDRAVSSYVYVRQYTND